MSLCSTRMKVLQVARCTMALAVPISIFGLAHSAPAQLLLPSPDLWHQDTPGISDPGDQGAESLDLFGATLAVGDFNGDGEDDMAVASPNEEIGGVQKAGAVHVLYGSSQGISAIGSQLWYEGFQGLGGSPGSSDQFGRALASCDFNADQFDDLVIGVPYKDIANRGDAGRFHVLYGSASGLSTVVYQTWDEGTIYGGGPQTTSVLGWSLACGNLDGDPYADLAIGALQDSAALPSGTVTVLYGDTDGLTAAGAQKWHQDSADIGGVRENWDYFGAALAVGNFDGDDYDDLAIGVPGEDLGAIANAGVVNVLYGTAAGLSSARNQFLSQDSPGAYCMAPGSGDEFGSALAAGDFNADGIDDLAIGAPGEHLATADDAGLVNVFDGSSGGLFPGPGQCVFALGGFFDHANFGYALASGDLDADGVADLIVGAPGHEVADPAVAAGAVMISFGSADPAAQERLLLSQDTAGVPGTPNRIEDFGYAIAVGDFDGSGTPDLAVGVAKDHHAGYAGSVNLFYSSVLFADGFEAGDFSAWSSGSP